MGSHPLLIYKTYRVIHLSAFNITLVLVSKNTREYQEPFAECLKLGLLDQKLKIILKSTDLGDASNVFR